MNTIVTLFKKHKLTTRLALFLERVLIEEKLGNLYGFSIVCAIGLFFTLVIAKTGVLVAALIAIMLVGIPVVFTSLLNIQFGLYCCLFAAYFIFHLNRFLGLYDLQTGVLIELFLITTSLGLFLKNRKNDKLWAAFINPITFLIVIQVAYYFVQFFNPNSLSISGWAFTLRGVIGYTLMYVICMHAFNNLESVKNFTKFWIFLALLAALYGIYQEVFGFTDFESRWVFSSEQRFKLIFIWGRFRRMSFLSDAATFGIFMAYSGIASLILATGPYRKSLRLVALIAGVLMFVSMSYSGTRTAYAVIPVGLGFFMLMSANNKRTVIFSIFLCFSLLAVLFGPFYSGPINRIRSTFSGDEDASYNVREDNRHQIQPFIMEHPMGGGVATTGVAGERFSPHHPLAAFPPDSGMLATALETGWIGLVIEYLFYFVVMTIGIINYFKSENLVVKNLYLAYLACFFAMTIANYAQVAFSQRPMNLLFYATFALVIKLKNIDSEIS